MSKNLPLNIEQIKKDKDGLDVLSDIFIYAVLGERVSEADLIRFQWYGIHAQGRDQKGDYFKLKIPLSLGELNLEQIKALSKISKEYANDSLDFTKSQKIEFSWLRIYDLPAVFNILQAVELSTTFESGHNVRNIILNCVNKEQLTDISEITNKLNDTFRGNKNFSNLPNKLQIAISGCARKAVENNTHDVNFDAVKNDKDKILFSVKIIGTHVGYITISQIIPMAKAIAKIYRDYGNRENEEQSNFASLIKKWGHDKFYDLLESSVSFRIKSLLIETNENNNKIEYFGIKESKVEGQSYIGCKLESLQIGSSGLDTLSSLLEKYNASKIQITTFGNMIIIDAPTNKAEQFAEDLQKVNFNPFA